MSNTITCPSGLVGRIRGKKGREERVVADRKLARDGTQLEQILAVCWEGNRERGATQDRDLFDWFQDVAITSSGLGLNDVGYKRNLDIVQQDRDGTTLRRWTLSGAWPVKFVAGEWDNEADENVIELVTLAFDYFELLQ